MTHRVLLLSQWFDPEPTSKGLVFARELMRQGFEVEVLTGFPNYPGGKLYPGYRLKWLQREVIDGVNVTRVALYPSHDQSAIRRIFNYLSFAASSILYGLILARRPDVIYAYHPPLTVGVSAVLIRFFRRVPLVYDVQDMWPDSLRATSMISNPRVLAGIGTVCRWVYRHVDHLVVLSPGFKRLLVARGVPERKIEVIYNWCNEAALAACADASLPGGDGKFRILFAGNVGKAQALDAVLEAAKILRDHASRVVFILLGGGVEVERLRRVAREVGLDNVLFLPQTSMAEAGALQKGADALLVHLRKDPLFEITIPSKTQSYMAAGKPILMAVRGDAAELIRQADCGVEAVSEDADSIAAAALRLSCLSEAELLAMGQRARNYYEGHLSMTVGASRFARIFGRLIEAQHSS